MKTPLTAMERTRRYHAQNGRDLVTRRQWRRIAHKQNRQRQDRAGQ